MKYGYTRISSLTQDGNTSLAGQEKEILERYPDAEIISEIHSGATKREKFEVLIENMQPGDLLCCTKLDRFCRTTKEGLQFVDVLLAKGCSIHILNMGLIENTAMGRLLVTQLLAFAEFERAQIVERTQEGRERARKQEGYKDGRKPKFTKFQLDHAVSLLDSFSYKQVESMTGISESTILRHKRKLKASK